MHNPPAMQEILSHAKGAFVGLAIGDSLGAPVEFMTPHEIKARHGILREIVGGGWLRIKPGQVTDDTQMSLCVARAIITANGWSLKGIADNFAAWMKSRPIDVGNACRKGIRNYMLKGELAVPFNQWGAGNGACMRMLPAALFTLGDDDLLAEYVMEQAHLTHNHPLSDAACLYLGKLIHLALAGHAKTRLRSELEGLFAECEAFRFEPYRGLATGYVVDTMQTVFHYFFKTLDFEDCLVGVINQGGDADTTGAIAGMLAGAHYGMENIPKRWIKKMDRQVLAEVTTLAEQLVRLSPLATHLNLR
jgi:ADP-ribosyl-[dinitrogen reductase] hydrolase